jgi:hypothetical protein
MSQDPEGNQQGPFTSEDMKNWLDHGYFTPSLMVAVAGEPTKDFKPISEFFSQISTAFCSVPKTGLS